jgi:hypothetical protein
VSSKKPIVDVSGKLKELPAGDDLSVQHGIVFPKITTPATPAAGTVIIYPKADGNFYQLDDAGLETNLAAAGGGGGGAITIISVNTTPYNLAPTSGRYLLLIDATSGVITVNLPTAVGNTAEFMFKKIDSTLNSVIIDGSTTETIDTELTKTILFQNTSFSIISDNTNWQRPT